MIELRVLGSAGLTAASGEDCASVLARPKRLALLVYLALASPPGLHRRDAVCALFWPESDQERARASLRQEVHQLRRVLGAAALARRGDEEVGLVEGAVRCDAVEFERALREDRADEALELYRGDLLPAFFVSGAPEFEEWLEGERARLRGAAAKAAWGLADAQARAGAREEAVALARRAAAFAPFDEAVQRRLLEFLRRLGHRDAALHAYEAYAARLAAHFDERPGAELAALATTIRSEGPPVPAEAPAAGTPREADRDGAPGPQRHGLLLFLAGAAIVLALAAVGRGLGVFGTRAEANARLLVVAPFRVAGADSTLAFLREGMLDLLSVKLTGAGGLRAADPRSVMSAWRARTRQGEEGDLPDSVALDAARDLGAGRLLLGAVVGRPDHLVLTASLLDTRRGTVVVDAEVQGRVDSLLGLVDALAGRLLTAEANEPALRLASLASTSFPALQAYLLGRSAFRAGRYAEAVAHLHEAVDLDSAFAVAWLELVRASDWLPGGDFAAASSHAWRLRRRLSPPDLAQLVAMLGPRFPSPPTVGERYSSWERAALLAPERPDAWYGLGDFLFHLGALTGRDSGLVRAETALSRAFGLDSTFTAPLEHLVQIAVLRGDAGAARRLARLYLSRDSTGEVATYLRWRVALTLGDTATARTIARDLDSLPLGTLSRMAGWAQVDGVGVETAWRAARAQMRRLEGRDSSLFAERSFVALASNLGRFRDRAPVWSRLLRHAGVAEDTTIERIAAAASLDGDAAPARAAAARLAASPARVPSAAMPCPTLTWVLYGPDPLPGTRAVDRLFRNCLANPGAAADPAIQLLHAAWTDGADLPRRLAALDSVRLSSVSSGSGNWLSLTEGLALMLRGDFAAARDAFRRRETGAGEASLFLAPLLRREGRAAELAHDTASAVRAYRHYLALRYDPDPGARPYADTVRSALARLARGHVPP